MYNQSLRFSFFSKKPGSYTRPPRNHKAAGLFLTVDFVSSHADVQITLKPGFATALQIAKGRVFPAPTSHLKGRARPTPRLGYFNLLDYAHGNRYAPSCEIP